MIYHDRNTKKRIDAVQWNGMNIYEISAFVGTNVTCLERFNGTWLKVNASFGSLIIPEDGYVIKRMESGRCEFDVVGKKYFDTTYEED